MDLILVRHGQSEGNITEGDFPDSPLTALGQQQAESAGRAVASLKPEILAASSLQRALQTATAAAKRMNLPIEVWKNAHEVRLGPDYDGPKLEEMRKMFPEAVFSEDIKDGNWGYVSDREVERARERASKLLEGLKEKYAGKRVAIFLHGTLNRMLIQSILGLPTYEKIRFSQPNACINRFQFNDDHIQVHCTADVSHLIQDGVEVS